MRKSDVLANTRVSTLAASFSSSSIEPILHSTAHRERKEGGLSNTSSCTFSGIAVNESTSKSCP